jgi:hypothetical protein
MNKLQLLDFFNRQYWYSKGYNDQQNNTLIPDHVWGYKKYFWQKSKYPKQYQKSYKEGQSKAQLDKQIGVQLYKNK